jgi:DNA-binding MarR family transcriptional regulator
MNQDISSSREIDASGLAMRFKEAIRANQAATDIFDETLSGFLGINRTDGRCIDIIERFGKVSAGQLAIESGLTTGAVTAVIDRLETAGYVRRIRDPIDRRKVWVEITDEMAGIIERVFGFYMRGGGRLMERFTPDQLDAIVRFLGIGAFLNTEMAAALREHFDPSAKTPAARLIAARAFERAMQANEARLNAEIDALDEKYCKERGK